MRARCIYDKLKIVAIALNVLLGLLSLVVIGVSIKEYVEIGFSAHLLGFDSLRWSTALAFLAGLTIIIFAIPASCFLANDSQYSQLLFSWLLFFLVFIAGLSAYYSRQLVTIKSEQKKNLKDIAIRFAAEEYGNPQRKAATEAIDDLQQQYECCGFDNNSTDLIWTVSNWYKAQTLYPRSRVPLSCCRKCSTLPITCFNHSQLSEITYQNCILAKSLCSGQDEYVNKQLCQGFSISPVYLPINVYRYEKECHQFIEEYAFGYASTIFYCSTVFASILFLQFILYLLLPWLLEKKYQIVGDSIMRT